MNRELKFRVWNMKTHKMHYPKHAALLFNDISWAFDGCDDLGKMPDGWCRYGDHHDSVLQQYTGIKDKNNKEIFEGDILFLEDDNAYFEVKWDSDGGKFIKINLNNKSDILDMEINLDSMVVLGNIFENPELIYHG